MTKKEKWLELYEDAKSKRAKIDSQIKRRNDLYKGIAQPIDPVTGAPARKRADCKRNMCFELIETQINNAIPQPKVTPRDPANTELAADLEGYLQMEMDRLCSEELNDSAERGTLKQGTAFYLVGWDETASSPITSGELFVKYYPLDRVYPQPGITDIHDAEYIFTEDLVSVEKIKEVYGVVVDEGPEFKGMNTLITVYYFNNKGNVSKFGWIKNTDTVVFDEEDYEIRKVKVCKKCGEKMYNRDVCTLCGDDHYKYVSMESEALPDDIVEGDPTKPNEEPTVLAKKGSFLKYYKIRELPFVMRRNISDDESLYGVSDIDLLEGNQISMNKILTKMEENVMKAGSFVTKPNGVNIPNTDETLKIVNVKDPNMMKAFSVQTVQANMQQDNILQEQFYQMGRDSLGITDSYQGKRDTTAESGKAKQVSAAQAAGRMESKRRMKDAAYAELYRKMFMYLLAYCDEKRVYARMKPNGEYVKGTFSRYNYLDVDSDGNLYYNDRFLFSVDDASTLATNRTAMWQETTNNFVSGTLGNPADPQTMMLYWNMMKGLNYPLAKTALESLQQRQQQLPYELQQAIMQNPDILKAVQMLASNPETMKALEQGGGSSENSKQ
jgi:hypothetical protein